MAYWAAMRAYRLKQQGRKDDVSNTFAWAFWYFMVNLVICLIAAADKH